MVLSGYNFKLNDLNCYLDIFLSYLFIFCKA